MKDKRLKRALTASLAAVCVLTAASGAACAAEADDAPSVASPGDWEESEDGVMTEAAQAAFDKATATLMGAQYEAVELVATQLVAGTNYRVLCKVTPSTQDGEPYYAILTIYEKLDGTAEVTNIEETDYDDGESGDIGGVDGGWEESEDGVMTEAAQAAFDKATATLMGAQYEAVELVATQLVAGTNYRVLCKITPSTLDGEPYYAILTIYEKLDGTAEVTNIEETDYDDGESGDIGSVDGGWEESEDGVMTEAAQAAFDKATATLMGAQYEAVELVATQLVAGTNYRVLCKVTPSTLDGEPYYAILTIYEKLDGTAEVTNIEEVEVGELPEESIPPIDGSAPGNDFDGADSGSEPDKGNPATGMPVLPAAIAAMTGITAMTAVISKKKRK